MRVGPRSDRINTIWSSGDFTGDQRAQARCTIQRCTQVLHTFATRNYRTINFEQADPPRELPNLKSIRIDRAVDQDAAIATITFYNTKAAPIGELPEYEKDIDHEGWYTFNRGTSPQNARWGYSTNTWRNWLREDRVLRTYQGFGIDPTVAAPDDPNLLQTGTWLIDEVDIDSAGDIVATCRDFAAFLIEQFVYPPVVPDAEYPMFFEMRHPETTILPADLLTATAAGSSNDAWGTNPYGHTAAMAFDPDMTSYWLSVGNSRPSADYAYEWIEAAVSGHVGEVRFIPWKGNYTVYVSVKIGGVWQGGATIPYNPNSAPAAPNGSNIRYVAQTTCGFEAATTISLAGYDNVERVRLTFTNLADSDLGSYQYRAGVRNFEVYTGPQPQVNVVGNISDYTDIVKQLCAMGGFYWPHGAPPLSTMADPALAADGRVYGDFETAGTGPVVDIPETVWDKKPLMDGVTYVKEILGFIFFMDETGGVVFRSPNLWRVGNYTLDFEGSDYRRVHVNDVLVIDEDLQLTRYKVKLSNRNKRKAIMVGTVDGRVRAEVAGDETIPAGEFPLNMERWAIWTDQNFCLESEALLMADLIKVRQNFTYRQGVVSMKANPNIQPDDQVRIVERRTNEGYLHYVSGISSVWDAATGAYDMDLTTFWLGEPASEIPGAWVVDLASLSPGTQEYLRQRAKI